MLDTIRKLNLQLFAEKDESGETAPPAGTPEHPTQSDGSAKLPETTFTQAQVDAIVANRLARQKDTGIDFAALGFADKSAAELALKTAKELEEKNKTDLQRAQEAREAAENALNKAQTTARVSIINAEARAQAATLGVPASSLPHVLKLADLSGVAVDDAGNPDAKAVAAAIEKVLTDVPAFKVAVTSGGANPATNPTTKDWKSMSLTERGELYRADRPKAISLARAAGINLE